MTIEYLPLFIAAGAITYATRYLGLAGIRQPPASLRVFLDYVPIAVFAALVAPDLATGGNDVAPRLLGAGVAALVVARFGTLWACIITGMTVYWLTRWLL